MGLHAHERYEGYWENGYFQPSNKTIQRKGKAKAILTFVNEDTPTPNYVQLDAVNKFLKAIRESGETSPDEFERVNFDREIDL
ncbi:MAG: hypothetical protein FWB80_06850 [Defluviitaleaceae bacterium]|nr:hypothetical protein [Defluviitaleaceae bacterium]